MTSNFQSHKAQKPAKAEIVTVAIALTRMKPLLMPAHL
jgi:hypothetical protein